MLNHTCDAGNVPIIDNLYLDMNGVIHNCSHGAGTDINTRMTEDEMVSFFTAFPPPSLLFCGFLFFSLFFSFLFTRARDGGGERRGLVECAPTPVRPRRVSATVTISRSYLARRTREKSARQRARSKPSEPRAAL